MTVSVIFTYHTGLKDVPFSNAQLIGNWNGDGYFTDEETSYEMIEGVGDDGCPVFQTTVSFDESGIGKEFRWKVLFDAPGGPNAHAIPTEENEMDSDSRHRCFTLSETTRSQDYYLTYGRRLGANRYWPAGAKQPGIRFSVWAPNARNVDVVLVDEKTGYVSDDGTGVIATFPMTQNEDGIWDTSASASPALKRYSDYIGKLYCFRVTKDSGVVAYRSDLFSRQQAGCGDFDPKGQAYTGRPKELDGRVSASVILDPDTICADLDKETSPEATVSAGTFWQNEFNPLKPIPSRIDDLIVYQLHVGSLGFGRPDAGNLRDAIAFVDHLESLGVNAVELLPINEFSGSVGWGYGTTHFFAIEHSAGGRDHLKHFVRECHQRGISVILDVVYNHYPPDTERAQWQFDSDAPERNIWYWYEGSPSDYENPDGGYIDNISTGYAPNFGLEQVRWCFIGSAIALATEFHIDGFRMDQVTSLHSYAVIHADGSPAERARVFGTKFLREWNRALKLIKPSIVTHAEDHSQWDQVVIPTQAGGLGFDAFWYADFYHHLVGGSDKGMDYAKLIRMCGPGFEGPQAMDLFAGALEGSGNRTVVYAGVHDHAGNAEQSARTIVLASGYAPLEGETRRYAEARCRFAFGMTILSAGTPFLFMGDEVGAAKKFTYDTFLINRENLAGLRKGDGARLFRFYQDMIRFSRRNTAVRSRELEVLYTCNETRVIAFRRWQGPDQLLIIGSLNNQLLRGYVIQSEGLPDGRWKETFSSDAKAFGGWNISNGNATLKSSGGCFETVLPPCGFLVFCKVG
ncbi:MAG: alpha amylase C-terminal domain-containing protein [Candidatus Riflebacteria bacterium]|nr:alpha amylase C-terminal domain-containing protein [Candidatus Riflebacteria bacterium]